MLRRKMVLVMIMAGVIGACWVVSGIAQQTGEEGNQQPPERQRDRSGDWRERVEQFRQQMQERMREQLGASEEEWKVLYPRIQKVQQLQRQTRGGFWSMVGWGGRQARRGRRGGQAQRPEVAPQRERSEVEKKTEALRNLLEDKSSGAEPLKVALDALRKARAKARQELEAARKELRNVVTVRQEAQLVLIGILD